MYDIRAIGCPLEVSKSSYEGNDRVRVIGNAKIWPAGVVELFDLTSIVPSAHSERPYGVVGQLLYLYEGHRKVTKVQATNLGPVLVTFSLCERKEKTNNNYLRQGAMITMQQQWPFSYSCYGDRMYCVCYI